jgi:hypothetical protein
MSISDTYMTVAKIGASAAGTAATAFGIATLTVEIAPVIIVVGASVAVVAGATACVGYGLEAASPAIGRAYGWISRRVARAPRVVPLSEAPLEEATDHITSWLLSRSYPEQPAALAA